MSGGWTPAVIISCFVHIRPDFVKLFFAFFGVSELYELLCDIFPVGYYLLCVLQVHPDAVPVAVGWFCMSLLRIAIASVAWSCITIYWWLPWDPVQGSEPLVNNQNLRKILLAVMRNGLWAVTIILGRTITGRFWNWNIAIWSFACLFTRRQFKCIFRSGNSIGMVRDIRRRS